MLCSLVGSEMCIGGRFSPSVWALVFASLVGAFTKLVGSHVFLTGTHDRVELDGESVRRLFRFGGWIFLSIIISFTANSDASLILGKFLLYLTHL